MDRVTFCSVLSFHVTTQISENKLFSKASCQYRHVWLLCGIVIAFQAIGEEGNMKIKETEVS